MNVTLGKSDFNACVAEFCVDGPVQIVSDWHDMFQLADEDEQLEIEGAFPEFLE